MRLPKLYGQTKSGKIKTWDVEVVENLDGTSSYTINHGLEDGKKTTSSQVISLGKNLGKSNETSTFEQAYLEARSKWQKQKDSGYAESINDIVDGNKRDLFLPMLAQRYDQHGSKITWPAYCQPKLDGCRCLARKLNNKVTLWSRKGKIFDVPKEIIKELNDILLDGQVLDGELYRHDWRSESGEPDFQRIISSVKKYNKDTPYLQYHIYDVPGPLSFKERFVDQVIPTTEKIILVPTYIVNSEKEAINLYEDFISRELPYEGAIIRNMNGTYLYDYRSYDLQKIKPSNDAEYKIIGGEEALGNDSGTVIFKCITNTGLEFSVRPIGTREQRREYWINLSKYIGKYLMVEYNGLTNDGKPRFPRGIRIREEWDMSKPNDFFNPFKD